ncbi:phosphoribosyl-AMP cyclohydrolase, partial [Micromonospora echinofusca]
MGHPPSLASGFLDDWCSRLRHLTQRPVVGILLRGSHARQAATDYSDVDLDVLVSGPSYAARPAFLADTAGRLTHLSVAVRDVDSWLRRLAEPADWAFGLPVDAPTRLLWADPRWRSWLDVPVLRQPAGEPRFEDLIANLGKVVGARAGGDALGARLAANDLAMLCPSVLRLANPSVTVSSRRTAFAAALALPVAPPGYRDDMLVCLGLRPAPVAEVCAAAVRLVTGAVPLVRPYAAELAGVTGTDLAEALTDGRLERYLTQLTGAATRTGSPVPTPRTGQFPT